MSIRSLYFCSYLVLRLDTFVPLEKALDYALAFGTHNVPQPLEGTPADHQKRLAALSETSLDMTNCTSVRR